jgi:thymidylate synthase
MMNVIDLSDLRSGYVELVDEVVNHGDPVTSRGIATRELTAVTYSFADPTGVMLPIGVNRGINTRLAAVEALQLLSGNGDPELLLRASPSYTDVLIRPEELTYGSYGPRLRRQIDAVYHELYAHPSTRRAVLSIWREEDLTHDGDRPCTLSLQFLLRQRVEDGEDELRVIVNLRSQDVWRGVPYDVFMFSQLQLSLAHQLGVAVGQLTCHVGSLHVYETDLVAAHQLIRCTDDRPAPVDYPRGVLSSSPLTEYPTEVAEGLINGSARPADVALNPWYVRQLVALGITQTEDGD